MPVVDLEQVTRMLGDPEVTRQLVERVLLDLPRYRSQLAEATAVADWLQVARVAHVLGGCVSNVNAARTSTAARQLEHAIKDGDLTRVTALAGRLASAAADLTGVLDDWCRKAPRTGGAAA